MRICTFAVFLTLLASWSSSGTAATLNVVGGQLLGASDVLVDGTLYDVEFVDGLCVDIFDGCDDDSDFAFGGNQSLAQLAALALLSQVFLDTPEGLFDSEPSLTAGCSVQCLALVPFFDAGTTAHSYYARNETNEVLDGFGIGSVIFWSDADDTSNYTGYVFSKFSVAVVPLPASLPLLMAALGGLGFAARRRKAA